MNSSKRMLIIALLLSAIFPCLLRGQGVNSSTVANVNGVLYASQQAGADYGAKWQACINALPAGGGTCVVDILGGSINSLVTMPGSVNASTTSILYPGSITCNVAPCVQTEAATHLVCAGADNANGSTQFVRAANLNGDLILAQGSAGPSDYWHYGSIDGCNVDDNSPNQSGFAIDTAGNSGLVKDGFGTLTVKTVSNNPLVAGQIVTISGAANASFNAVGPIQTIVDAQHFTMYCFAFGIGAGTSGSGKVTVGAAIHVQNLGETSTLSRINIRRVANVGVLYNSGSAGTGKTESVSVFQDAASPAGCAFYSNIAGNKLIFLSIGGDMDASMFCMFGGGILNIQGYKHEDESGTGGLSGSDPSFLLDVGGVGNVIHLAGGVIWCSHCTDAFHSATNQNGSGDTIQVTATQFLHATNAYHNVNAANTKTIAVTAVTADAQKYVGQWSYSLGDGVFSTAIHVSCPNVTLANGANENISLDADGGAGCIRIIGPSGAFSLGGFTSLNAGAHGNPLLDGRELKVYSSVSQTMTISNQDASSTAGNRILTLTGGNVVCRATAPTAAMFFYSGADSRWILLSPTC